MEQYGTDEPGISQHRYREWLINFYRDRLEYFMDNVGKRTKHNTLITPSLINTTMKRLKQLVDKYKLDEEYI
jgi:hypothetical protein